LIPLLVLGYFFIHYTTDLFYLLEPGYTLLQFCKYTVATAIPFYAGYRLSRDKQRFVFAFTTILFWFLFFGSIVDTAAGLRLIKPVLSVDLKMILLFLIICFVTIFLSVKLKKNTIGKLLLFWMIYCSILILYDTAGFILSSKPEQKYLHAALPVKPLPVGEKPSVFFLLFDMYPSDSVFKKYFRYDNTALASFLTQKGFFVTGNAHALYDETYYSLGSTLDLAPLAYLTDGSVPDYKKRLIALKNIKNATLPAIFQRSGYVFRNFSVFDLQGQASPLRFSLNYHLQNALTSPTFFNRLYQGIEPDFILANRNIDLRFFKSSWSDNLESDLLTLNTRFNELLDTFPAGTPSFNYFHFMMPHPPVLYDSNGKKNGVRDMYTYKGFDQATANFVRYTKYANKEIMRLVDKIFEKAGKNTVILVQGDHGYREYYKRFPDEVRQGILNAVYLPGKNYSNFNDTMTAIHTFEQVLKNQYNYQP
jgi:hypothetical protein